MIANEREARAEQAYAEARRAVKAAPDSAWSPTVTLLRRIAAERLAEGRAAAVGQ